MTRPVIPVRAASVVPVDGKTLDAQLSPPRTRRRTRWSLTGIIGGVLVAFWLFIALFGVWLAPYEPGALGDSAVLASYSPAHLLGTDYLGRDVLSRILDGARFTVGLALVAAVLACVLGTGLGLLAALSGRWVDEPLSRLIELFLALPLLPLLLLMVTLFREPLSQAMGPGLGTFLLIVTAIGATSWMQAARIVRGDVLGLKEREFILAARSIGTPNFRMMTRHVLPNVLSPIMVAATLGIATAIITESALSFLGLGFPPDFPTWGRLLYDAIEQMQMYPWRVILPGIFISLTVLTVNYIGDGLRDAMDPRIRGR